MAQEKRVTSESYCTLILFILSDKRDPYFFFLNAQYLRESLETLCFTLGNQLKFGSNQFKFYRVMGQNSPRESWDRDSSENKPFQVSPVQSHALRRHKNSYFNTVFKLILKSLQLFYLFLYFTFFFTSYHLVDTLTAVQGLVKQAFSVP